MDQELLAIELRLSQLETAVTALARVVGADKPLIEGLERLRERLAADFKSEMPESGFSLLDRLTAPPDPEGL